MTPALSDALHQACALVGVEPPKRKLSPGRWVRTDTKGKNGKDDASVMLFDDLRGGIVWNHQTAESRRFSVTGDGLTTTGDAPKRDMARERRNAEEQQEVARVCERIVRACRQEPHPYLERKGFSEEPGLVIDDPREHFPRGRLGEFLTKALPDGGGPYLIVPGRIGKRLTTVQFITPVGAKKNILRGAMSGACHRISTGRVTWVCEGIATALSVRAGLRVLGVNATVLSAFSASNAALVARGINGARIAADHDKPVESFDGLGTGEYYARRSGRRWVMPATPGDYNDLHMAEGLRAVALSLREALG